MVALGSAKHNHRDSSARLEHAPDFPQGLLRVGEVHQAKARNDRVERSVFQFQILAVHHLRRHIFQA